MVAPIRNQPGPGSHTDSPETGVDGVASFATNHWYRRYVASGDR
ncbi:MAG: hypothetical protein J07HX64_02051 [halophilic archaeon J07HX64]|nr:MAG: hypothetical protein J07HX64_02051 [halophilic archaeon J07HX64]